MSNVAGVISLSRPLTDNEFYFLSAFALNKRMRRHRPMLEFMIADGQLEDPFREDACLPLGMDGYFFVGNNGVEFNESDPSVFNKEQPPRGMPGCWCSWQPAKDNRSMLVLSGKKEHHAILWASFLVTKLFAKHWNMTAKGIITITHASSGGTKDPVKAYTDIAIVKGNTVISSQKGKHVTPADQF